MTAGDKTALRQLKSDILRVLSDERRLLGLSVEQFRQSGRTIEIRAPWWPDTLWFVPTTAELGSLLAEGVERGRIWTASELAGLAAIDGLSDDEAQTLGRVKASLNLGIVAVDSATDEPKDQSPPDERRTCPCCHEMTFWRSVHGAIVCAKCHPPADDDLVDEWIDGPDVTS